MKPIEGARAPLLAILAVVGAVCLSGLAPAQAQTQTQAPNQSNTTSQTPVPVDTAPGLKPHRAVYELTLAQSKTSSGISSMSGRMVYDRKGSPCKGFSDEMRLVSRLAGADGEGVVNDLRSKTSEPGDGSSFEFDIQNFQNDELNEESAGRAVRGAGEGGVEVKLEAPGAETFELPAGTMFPIQHLNAVLAAAARGDKSLVTDLYDGSENGRKFYSTSAQIGLITPKPGGEGAATASGPFALLNATRAWSVALAFYDARQNDPYGLPSFEVIQTLYENGISGNFFLDYGEFSLNGKLVELELYEAEVCPN